MNKGAHEEDEMDVLLNDDQDDAKKAEEDEKFTKKEIGFEDMMKYGFAEKESFGSIKCSQTEFGNPASD